MCLYLGHPGTGDGARRLWRLRLLRSRVVDLLLLLRLLRAHKQHTSAKHVCDRCQPRNNDLPATPSFDAPPQPRHVAKKQRFHTTNTPRPPPLLPSKGQDTAPTEPGEARGEGCCASSCSPRSSPGRPWCAAARAALWTAATGCTAPARCPRPAPPAAAPPAAPAAAAAAPAAAGGTDSIVRTTGVKQSISVSARRLLLRRRLLL